MEATFFPALQWRSVYRTRTNHPGLMQMAPARHEGGWICLNSPRVLSSPGPMWISVSCCFQIFNVLTV